MKKSYFVCLFIILLLCLLFSISVIAHPGRLDSRGGHYVRSPGQGYPVGSYHYHNNDDAYVQNKTLQNESSGTQDSLLTMDEQIIQALTEVFFESFFNNIFIEALNCDNPPEKVKGPVIKELQVVKISNGNLLIDETPQAIKMFIKHCNQTKKWDEYQKQINTKHSADADTSSQFIQKFLNAKTFIIFFSFLLFFIILIFVFKKNYHYNKSTILHLNEIIEELRAENKRIININNQFSKTNARLNLIISDLQKSLRQKKLKILTNLKKGFLNKHNKKSRPGGAGRLFAQDASVHHLEKGMFMNKVIITYPFFNVKQLERICYYEKTCRWQMAKEKSH